MSETSAIEIKDLRVDYGNFVAGEDISLAIPFGEVYGLVGPNGAGKTSTFKVLATLMEQTYGEYVAGAHRLQLPVHGMSEGMYLLRLQHGDAQYHEKLIIRR